MQFRFIGTARDFLLQSGHDLEIPQGGPHRLLAHLRRATDEEVESGHGAETTFCVVRGEWNVSANNRGALDSLARRQLPKGWNRVEGWESQVDEEGRFRGVDIVWLTLLPQGFQEMACQVKQVLTDAAARMIGLARWRRNQPGPHSPLAQVSFSWSADGEAWNHMPHSVGMVLEIISGMRTSEGFAREITQLLSDEGAEPIGHRLFREAWENRITDRRSSLLVGIAAAEVGFKDCVTALVPATEWLTAR